MYERFVGITKQNRTKTYITSDSLQNVLTGAKKILKVTTKNILIQRGWVLDEELYFKNPKTKGQHKVWVASYIA